MIREGPPGLLASRFGDISRPKDTGEKIEIQIKGKRAKEFIEKKEEKDYVGFDDLIRQRRNIRHGRDLSQNEFCIFYK